jgi:hypothetical protein
MPRSDRDTVVAETPARRATSRIVAALGSLFDGISAPLDSV